MKYSRRWAAFFLSTLLEGNAHLTSGENTKTKMACDFETMHCRAKRGLIWYHLFKFEIKSCKCQKIGLEYAARQLSKRKTW